MTDETYNGWRNRASWAVSLHINNDQGFQEWAIETIEDAQSYDRDPADALAEMIDTMVEDALDAAREAGHEAAALLIRDLLPTLHSDAEVDYPSIAEGLLPVVAGWNMTGYLPETTPVRFRDLESAAGYIAETIERHVIDPHGDLCDCDYAQDPETGVEVCEDLRHAISDYDELTTMARTGTYPERGDTGWGSWEHDNVRYWIDGIA